MKLLPNNGNHRRADANLPEIPNPIFSSPDPGNGSITSADSPALPNSGIRTCTKTMLFRAAQPPTVSEES
jgi:hypothetical protein